MTNQKKSDKLVAEYRDAETEVDESQRFYQGQESLDHDLYKLDVAKMRRNTAIQGEPPVLDDIEHVHHFHSVDSSGRKQTRSYAIGGHFHEMELVKPATKKTPAIYRCGPPMRDARVKIRGKIQKKCVPAVVYQDKNEKGEPIAGGERILDTHSHEVVYLRSNKIQMRKVNPDAVNVVAREANLTAPIPGVSG